MDRSRVVDDLQAQHDRLRRLAAHCEDALDAAESGRATPAELAQTVRALRAALVDHHAFEELHLDLLGDHAGHAAHHAALSANLDDPALRTLTAVLRDLRDHLTLEDQLLATLPR